MSTWKDIDEQLDDAVLEADDDVYGHGYALSKLARATLLLTICVFVMRLAALSIRIRGRTGTRIVSCERRARSCLT
jgi:hypothetical protein